MKLRWSDLTHNQKEDWIEKALYLIDHGYIDSQVSVDSLAEVLYYKSKVKLNVEDKNVR